MTVAHQLCFENRPTPTFFFVRGRRRTDKPACFRRAGFRLGGKAQEDGRHILLRAGEREAPAGDEIENFRGSRNLDHDGAERCTGECIGSRLDRIIRMRGADQKDLRRIDTESDKTGGREFTELQCRKILPDPENLLFAGHTRRKSGGEGRGSGFGICGGIDFVQRTARQTAL